MNTIAIRRMLWGVVVVAGCAPVEEPVPEVEFESEADAQPLPDSGMEDAEPPWDGGTSPTDPMSWVEHTAFMDVLLNDEGRSAALEVEVPADAVSLAVVVRGSPELVFVTEEIIDPEGRAVVSPSARVPAEVDSTDALLFPEAFFSPNRTYWAPGAAVTMVPNNPEIELRPGTWRVRVAAVDALGWPKRAIVDVLAQVKRRPAVPVRYELPLHFYFSGSGDLSASWAAVDPDFQAALESVTETFADAGIEIAGVSYQDIDARWQRVHADHDLASLYSLSEYDNGVHVFMVDRIENDQGDVIGGLSGGVPGPSGMPGSPRSGVVVAHTLEPDPDRVGLMIAHEVGHYLGLFHTAEMIPGYVDQLPDTPDDDRARRNVMYPIVGDSSQRFTSDQAAVLRRGPAVVDVDID